VLLHLAAKAFKPGNIPFPVLHVDTGHNFPEVLTYRDAQVEALGARLIVAKVQDSIDQGRVADPGPVASRNRLQTTTLLDAINEHRFDAAFGGARRDEDKARAKERVLSFRDSFGQWDPKRQRPELWQLYQGSVRPGEHLRAFPLSDFTELDVWQYIRREHIVLPSIYYAHTRPVIERDGMLLAVSEWVSPRGAEVIEEATVRYRTVGDATLTGAVRSQASTVEDIIGEVAASRISERGATRGDDRFSETAMEDRKREGYF
jgi:sulfate adenylyltransferase subunit 2